MKDHDDDKNDQSILPRTRTTHAAWAVPSHAMMPPKAWSRLATSRVVVVLCHGRRRARVRDSGGMGQVLGGLAGQHSPGARPPVLSAWFSSEKCAGDPE